MSTLAASIAVGSVGMLVVSRLPGSAVALVAAAIAFVMLTLGASLAPHVSGGGVVSEPFWGAASLGISGGLRLDGLSLVFVLLITGIGTLIFLYANAYLKGDPRLGRLVVILVAFMTAMVGAVTADDVIVLFVFWELTSLTSFFLVGFDHEKLKARKAALQALLITGGGGLALLAGLVLVSIAAGTTSLSGILAAREAVLADPLAMPAMLLVILGCFTKSAQVPFHFWLPAAMAAPTPVSAYLHSATMVKLGVYLLARLNPLYQDVELWQHLLTLFGAATAVTGAVLALRETDLKLVLAYTTVTALGTLVMLIGIAPEQSITAAVTFLIVHALYKAALFMVAGIVDHETGSRDAASLGGLARAMPLTAAVAVLAALSMAGLPPFVGFVAKELIYEAKLELGATANVLLAVSFVVNAATVAIACVLSFRLFYGARRPTPEVPHDPSPAMLVGPLVLATLGLFVGLMPDVLGRSIIDPAVGAILGAPADIRLKLWHGFNVVLMLSAATISVGVVIYLAWARIVPRLRAVSWVDAFSPSRAYENGLESLLRFAGKMTRFIQHGSLSGYIRTLFVVTALAVLATLTSRGGFAWPEGGPPVDARALVVVLLAAGAIATMVARTALAAVLALGLVGFSAALLFMVFGAPDVAFTQFAVETLMVAILATALVRLPIRGGDLRDGRRKAGDLVVAGFCGVAIVAVLAAVVAAPFDARLSTWFGAESVPSAHGRNVVNVILVDFRALDTLGEITVLAIAAFAVAALLRRAVGARKPASEIEP
jgi:multicomponent Na+:H+ antiporter subunit A